MPGLAPDEQPTSSTFAPASATSTRVRAGAPRRPRAREVRHRVGAYPQPHGSAGDCLRCDRAHRTRVPARCARAIDHRPPRARTSLPWPARPDPEYGGTVTADTSPGATWGVGHGPGTGDARSSRTPGATSRVGPAASGHEPSNHGHPASRPGRGGGGGMIGRRPHRRIGSRMTRGASGMGAPWCCPPRALRDAVRSLPTPGPPPPLQPAGSGARAAATTRAASRRSGSRVMARASQSSRRSAPGPRSRRASGRGTSRRRSAEPAPPPRSAAAGDGRDGRAAAPGVRSGRRHGRLRCLRTRLGRAPAPRMVPVPVPRGVVVALRCWRRSVVSKRAVTGRVRGGGGGPDGRAFAAPFAPFGAAAAGSPVVPGHDPGRRAAVLPLSRSSAYAALISAMRRVAARRSVAFAVRSGWCSRASRRQAALIVATLDPGATPRTAWGSRRTIPSS